MFSDDNASAWTEVRMTYKPSNAASSAIRVSLRRYVNFLIFDLQHKVLAHLVMIENLAHANANLVFAPQRTPVAARGGGDFFQLFSVAASNSCRLRARSSARSGLRQTISLSSG